ncbi:hypothetical protein ACIQVK_19520 [Streptomyces sp. NPDC090493]|uniref:hypothetical protein n=1 Tax=Streptomyces sp. NPDC090493 TaxID=3365964 RepID=UPI00380787F1
MEFDLHETLGRLERCIDSQGLSRSDLLDPAVLAEKTAMPQSVIEGLLAGGDGSPGDIEQRVTSRIRVLTNSHLARTGKRLPDLISDVARHLDISSRWARMLLQGERMPNVALLHRLAHYFHVAGGESFFTAAPTDALNRELMSILHRLEPPEQDPLKALLAKHGVVGTDLRLHGELDPAQLEQIDQLVGNILRTVLQPRGETP